MEETDLIRRGPTCRANVSRIDPQTVLGTSRADISTKSIRDYQLYDLFTSLPFNHGRHDDAHETLHLEAFIREVAPKLMC